MTSTQVNDSKTDGDTEPETIELEIPRISKEEVAKEIHEILGLIKRTPSSSDKSALLSSVNRLKSRSELGHALLLHILKAQNEKIRQLRDQPSQSDSGIDSSASATSSQGSNCHLGLIEEKIRSILSSETMLFPNAVADEGGGTINPSINLQQQPERTSKRARFARTADMLQRSGLLDVTMKTADLIRRNQQLEKEIRQLRADTEAFVKSVLTNPENRHLLEAKVDFCVTPNMDIQVLDSSSSGGRRGLLGAGTVTAENQRKRKGSPLL